MAMFAASDRLPESSSADSARMPPKGGGGQRRPLMPRIGRRERSRPKYDRAMPDELTLADVIDFLSDHEGQEVYV